MLSILHRSAVAAAACLAAATLTLALVPLRSVLADEPPNPTYAPPPPGTVVQNQLVYLAGQAMHSQWRAIASKKQVGRSGSTVFNQWYLSIYSINNTTYRLKYQSPSNGGPLSRVTKASGGTMWFPYQDLKIVGVGQFMQPAVENLVVWSHETGADCGGATVTVFAYNYSGNKVYATATATNPCDLKATIMHSGSSYSIKLTGPYYAASAALCCPTKPNASATLRYSGGKWVMSPKIFALK
jgi:hypothetical protein